ncbi:MAG: maleylpyruvate isomerase N-terminal domain-containing protein [Hyphomonas sp.]
MQQAEDFRQETRALSRLVTSMPVAALHQPTQFKTWTIMDVLRHLHFWNMMAHLQLSDPAKLAGISRRCRPAQRRCANMSASSLVI